MTRAASLAIQNVFMHVIYCIFALIIFPQRDGMKPMNGF